MLANTRAMKGESTQSAKRTSRRREGLRWPAWSIKPTEPTAPASTAIRAAAWRKPRNPPSVLLRLTLEVISPRPFRQFTGQKFEWTETHNHHSIPAQHNPNSEKADTFWMPSCLASVEKRAHGQFSSIGSREKSSLFMSQFTFERPPTIIKQFPKPRFSFRFPTSHLKKLRFHLVQSEVYAV